MRWHTGERPPTKPQRRGGEGRVTRREDVSACTRINSRRSVSLDALHSPLHVSWNSAARFLGTFVQDGGVSSVTGAFWGVNLLMGGPRLNHLNAGGVGGNPPLRFQHGSSSMCVLLLGTE